MSDNSVADPNSELRRRIHALPDEITSRIFLWLHHPSYTFVKEPLMPKGFVSSVEHRFIFGAARSSWCGACGEQLGDDWICCGETGIMMCRCCGEEGRCHHCELAKRLKPMTRMAWTPDDAPADVVGGAVGVAAGADGPPVAIAAAAPV